MGFVRLGLILFMVITSGHAWQKDVSRNRAPEQNIYIVQLEDSSKASELEQICATDGLNILQRDPSRNLYLMGANEACASKLQAALPDARVERAMQVLVEVEKEAEIARAVEALGGFAKRRYDNVPFQAVAVPVRRLRGLLSIPGVKNLRKEKAFRPAPSN